MNIFTANIRVCFANYCRSPVAEQLMQEIQRKIQYYFSRDKPLNKPEMDPRSRNFLLQKIDGIDMHNQRISRQIVENQFLFLLLIPLFF